jgi:hypothetical protein
MRPDQPALTLAHIPCQGVLAGQLHVALLPLSTLVDQIIILLVTEVGPGVLWGMGLGQGQATITRDQRNTLTPWHRLTGWYNVWLIVAPPTVLPFRLTCICGQGSLQPKCRQWFWQDGHTLPPLVLDICTHCRLCCLDVLQQPQLTSVVGLPASLDKSFDSSAIAELFSNDLQSQTAYTLVVNSCYLTYKLASLTVPISSMMAPTTVGVC